MAEKNSRSIGTHVKEANNFFYYLIFFRLTGRDKFINSISNNSNFLYLNLIIVIFIT